nr:hypothetical protein [Mycobacterium szulgai]
MVLISAQPASSRVVVGRVSVGRVGQLSSSRPVVVGVESGPAVVSGRARTVRASMVITGAPLGSLAWRLKVSGPVGCRATRRRCASVACRSTPAITNGTRGPEGAAVSVVSVADSVETRGCRAASSRAGWMP